MRICQRFLPPSVKLKMPIYPARSRKLIFCRRRSYAYSGWLSVYRDGLFCPSGRRPPRRAKPAEVLHRILSGLYERGDTDLLGMGFCYQHDWRWLHAEPERAEALLLWCADERTRYGVVLLLTRDDCIRREDVIKALIVTSARILTTLSNSSGVCISLSILPKICSYRRRWRKMGWWILARREFR